MAESDTIRVLLAEDQDLVRGAIAALLALEPDLEVVAEVAHGDHVVVVAQQSEPDVVLLDIELPGRSGLDCVPDLREHVPAAHVIMLTTFTRPGLVVQAIEDGVMGFLSKEIPAAELATAIRRVVAGERVIEPELALEALQAGRNPLTAREQEVLLAASDGSTIQAIARRMFLSPGTVRNHVSAAMGKLGAGSRAEAVRLADDRGWLRHPARE